LHEQELGVEKSPESSDTWSPEQYHRFRNERRQPFIDLFSMVSPGPDMHVVDLGCGTGELTRHVHELLSAAETVGVDNAKSMLAKAEAQACGGLQFVLHDLATFGEGKTFDLIFSNAALHWIPNHRALFSRLASQLNPGGQIAVQIPYNFDQPSHVAADIAAEESPFREALGGYVKPVHVLPPERYAHLFHTLGFKTSTVRVQVYQHLLPSREAIVEWVKGTTLTDFRGRLPDELFQQFVERYQMHLFEMVPDDRPLLFTFNRILMWARR